MAITELSLKRSRYTRTLGKQRFKITTKKIKDVRKEKSILVVKMLQYLAVT